MKTPPWMTGGADMWIESFYGCLDRLMISTSIGSWISTRRSWMTFTQALWNPRAAHPIKKLMLKTPNSILSDNKFKISNSLSVCFDTPDRCSICNGKKIDI